MMNRGCNNSFTCPHLGGHEGGVHGLDGPQASVCEHYQQGGQQVTISLLVLFVTFRFFCTINSTGWFLDTENLSFCANLLHFCANLLQNTTMSGC